MKHDDDSVSYAVRSGAAWRLCSAALCTVPMLAQGGRAAAAMRDDGGRAQVDA